MHTKDKLAEALRAVGLAEMADRADSPTATLVGHLAVEAAKAEEALRSIVQWSEAYPLDIFPEPDWPKVRALLAAGGITLDAVSASNMRHAVKCVGEIAKKALED